jgi:hypothetical protein
VETTPLTADLLEPRADRLVLNQNERCFPS